MAPNKLQLSHLLMPSVISIGGFSELGDNIWNTLKASMANVRTL